MTHKELLTRLLNAAGRFYTGAEAPSEEDMGTVFYYLATRNVEALEDFVDTFEGVEPKDE